jgi:hypothetical protein
VNRLNVAAFPANGAVRDDRNIFDKQL